MGTYHKMPKIPKETQTLDEKFAADCPQLSSPDPFVKPQWSSLSGGVIQLVASEFDEVNIDLVKLLMTLGKHTVSCDEGNSIFPLLDTS